MSKRLDLYMFLAMMMAVNVCFAQRTKQQDDPYLLQKACEVVSEESDVEKAIQLLNEQLKQTPNHTKTLMFKAVLQSNEEQYMEAISSLNTAIKTCKKKDSDLPWLYYQRSTCWEHLNEIEKALEDVNTAIRLQKKSNDEEDLAYMLAHRAQVYYDMSEYEKSDADYEALLTLDSSDETARIGIARNKLNQKRYDEALELLNKEELFFSDYAEVYRYRMLVYDEMGETDKAIKDALRYCELDHSFDWNMVEPILSKHTSYSLAEIAFKKRTSTEQYLWRTLEINLRKLNKDYASAIKACDEFAEQIGPHIYISNWKAECLYQMGHFNKAAEVYTEVMELAEGENATLFNLRGRSYMYAGRKDEALADFSQAIEVDPRNGQSYYLRGWCKELYGDDKGAMQDYEAGIDLDKDYPYLYLMRGEQFLKQEKKEKAEADFRIILEKDTTLDNGSCRQYALAFLRQEQEALKWMDDIIALDSTDAGNYYDKACLCARLGHLDSAIEALEKALELGFCQFIHIDLDDDIDPLRNMPEFKSLMERYRFEATEDGTTTNSLEPSNTTISEIPMKRMFGGTYEIPCTINGLELKFVFDTGASTVTMSSVEANFMYKNGYISREDIKGTKYFGDANGDICEGTVVILKEIKIGEVVLTNIEASVVKGQNAPLLLGQSALERFGIITIDNINSRLLIKPL